MKLLRTFFLVLLAGSFFEGLAQQNPVSQPGELVGQQRAITTAVPFIGVTPDARHAALGDAGVATSPDVNSAYWNAGKLVFLDNTKKYGASVSYTPWLGKIVTDMSISSLAGFYRIDREQAVAVSLKYFDLGEISFRGMQNEPLGDFNPKEAAFDATYSRMLTENLGLGITGRYIYSNLTGAFTGSDEQAGHNVAADLGVFYTKPLQGARNSTLSLDAQVSNIGAKISYTDNNSKDFLPTNLRLGGAYSTDLNAFNTLTFVLDFNKLMVPSPGANRDTVSLLSGMFGSFSDAPGGFKEELQEFMTSVGVEYWYRNTFAGRVGYFNEHADKGNRKYMT